MFQIYFISVVEIQIFIWTTQHPEEFSTLYKYQIILSDTYTVFSALCFTSMVLCCSLKISFTEDCWLSQFSLSLHKIRKLADIVTILVAIKVIPLTTKEYKLKIINGWVKNATFKIFETFKTKNLRKRYLVSIQINSKK